MLLLYSFGMKKSTKQSANSHPTNDRIETNITIADYDLSLCHSLTNKVFGLSNVVLIPQMLGL
jgi:hypothetical protein